MTPPYPRYKSSRAPWIGQVPAHWNVLRFKALFEIMKRIIGFEGPDVLSVTQQGLQVKNLEGSQGQFAMDYSKYQIVNPGDFVMNHMDLLTGFADLSRQGGVTSPDYRVFRLRRPKDHCSKFFLHVVQDAYRRRIFYAFGQGASHYGRWRLSTKEFYNFVAAIPPLPEQQAIAAFLDRETGKIDALVEEQRRLIALLREKRQAVISLAITKGLDPTASKKPSGIDWLGDIPAHWRVTKVGWHARILAGFAFPSEGFSQHENDTRLLRGVNVGVGSIRWDDTVYWQRREGDRLDQFELAEGDIVVGMDRTWIGSGARVAKIGAMDVPALLLQRVASIRTDRQLKADFLYLLLRSYGFAHSVTPEMTGVSVPHISPSQIASFSIPLPAANEQEEIVRYVNVTDDNAVALIKAAKDAVALLDKRRAALIAAAVTGKIDVRDAAPELTEAA